jgi:hypothetical protein
MVNRLGKTYFAATSELGFMFPQVLLPNKNVDLKKWAVVACDQHTSDLSYWKKVEELVGDAPSTFRLMYPEVFLGKEDPTIRIQSIHLSMQNYEASDIFEPLENSFVYLERFTKESGLRQGVILGMDLECYDYSPDSTSLIRATEGTIVDRLPPRVNIRKGAPLELPHIMILIDDPEQSIIEPYKEFTHRLSKLYETDLMLDGGKVTGYGVEDTTLVETFILQLKALYNSTTSITADSEPDVGLNIPMDNPKGFLFAMGDGNHSLATAKTIWETMKSVEIKKSGSWKPIEHHLARYALAEIVNLHSPGLRFEPIHRLILQGNTTFLIDWICSTYNATVSTPSEPEIKSMLEKDPRGQRSIGVYDQDNWKLITLPEDLNLLPNDVVDKAYEASKKFSSEAEIDFIHGWNHTKELAKKMNGSAWLCPVIGRDRLFHYVKTQGPLPRKAFSMGDAQEKRYYMETRKIIP